MKYVIICVAILLFSCIPENEKTGTHQDNNASQNSSKLNKKFPYTEKNVRKFYNYDTEKDLHELNIKNLKWTNFELNELDLSIK